MDNLVFFHYDKGSRAQKVVIELLHNYKDAVQTDGYDVYSIYEDKQACDINPREWMTDVLNRIPEYNNNYDLDLADLLPHNWKKSKCQEKSN